MHMSSKSISKGMKYTQNIRTVTSLGTESGTGLGGSEVEPH